MHSSGRRLFSMLSSVFVVSAVSMLSSSSSKAATPVQAADLCGRSRDFADQTIALDDELVRVAQRFTTAERAVGYQQDTHLKLVLKTSCIAAVVARTPATEALLNTPGGLPIHIEGVVHVDDVRRRDRDYMGTDVDITVMGGTDVAALIDVKTMSMGPYRQVRGLQYENVASVAASQVDVDVRVKPAIDGFSFRRAVSPGDGELQATAHNTIKIVGLVAGAVVYVQRTAANLAFVTSFERGDVIVIEGRIVPTPPGTDRVFVVDAWRRKP